MRPSVDDDKKRPIDWVACNPFSFLRMFSLGKSVRRLMLILALQSFGEGRVMQDINMMFLGNHLNSIILNPAEVRRHSHRS